MCIEHAITTIITILTCYLAISMINHPIAVRSQNQPISDYVYSMAQKRGPLRRYYSLANNFIEYWLSFLFFFIDSAVNL